MPWPNSSMLRLGYSLFDDDALPSGYTDESGLVTNQNAVFVDQANHDYSLTSSSTNVIDAGGYLGSDTVTFTNSNTRSIKFVDVDNDGTNSYEALTDVIVWIDGGVSSLDDVDYEDHYIYTTDLDGNARLSGDNIDMGAYERPVAAAELAGPVFYLR